MFLLIPINFVGYGDILRISTKGRYGLNAVFLLSRIEDQKPLSLKQIASELNVPLPYLEQIVIKLRKDGYVDSTRGAKGGYLLAKAPSEISIYNLLQSLEGEILPVHCKHTNSCNHTDDGQPCCAGKIVWEKINLSVKDVLRDYTLQDLIDEYKN